MIKTFSLLLNTSKMHFTGNWSVSPNSNKVYL